MRPRTTADTPLTSRQAAFVEQYLICLNAGEAAKRAGYSQKNANCIASRTLKEPNVLAAITRAMAARSVRTGITADRVLKETELLAFSDISHYDIDDDGTVTRTTTAPPHALRAISTIKRRVIRRGKDLIREVEVRLWDKPGPLKLAGRHVGLFPDRVEITGADGGPVQLQAVRSMSDEALVSRTRELLAKFKTDP